MENQDRSVRYFITGGSGFIGINLIRFLLKRGHSVVNYDIAPFEYPEKRNIKSILGDVRDEKLLLESMKESDVVVHCAAALPLYSKEDIFSTDVDGTQNVLESAQKNSMTRVVYLSSTAVYGIPDHHPLFETDALVGVGYYGTAKISAEKLCREYRNAGLCVSIIRPKTVVGPERLGVFALLYDWAKDGHNFPVLGNGKNRYQLLDVDDLCSAIYACTFLPKENVNDTFNIGAKEFATMREDYQAVLDRSGFKKKVIGIPAGPAIAILKVLERLHVSPLYAWVYGTASKDSFVSIQKAEEVLHYKPLFSNKEALVRNYEWYLNNYTNFKEKSGVSHRVPWKQGVLGCAKFFF